MALYLKDFRQGDTVTIKIDYGTGVNISGFKFWLTLKTNFTDEDVSAALQHSTTAGDTASDDVANGIAYLIIPASLTKNVTPNKYYYDLQALAPSGDIKTIIPPVEDYKDRVLVIPEVTKAIA